MGICIGCLAYKAAYFFYLVHAWPDHPTFGGMMVMTNEINNPILLERWRAISKKNVSQMSRPENDPVPSMSWHWQNIHRR
jgi:hypothetical protein